MVILSNLKALWINSGDFPLNDKVREKIQQSLDLADNSIAEHQLNEISLNAIDGYDCFIVTVNRQYLLQDLYRMIGERGQMLVVNTEGSKTEECDWEVNSPCGTHRLNLSGLSKLIVQDGRVVDIEQSIKM